MNSGGYIYGILGVGQPAWADANVPHAGTTDTNWAYDAGNDNYTSCILYPAPNTPAGTSTSPTRHNVILTRKSWPSATTWSDNRTPLYNVPSNDTPHYEWWKPYVSRVGRLGRAIPSGSAIGGSYYLRIPIMLAQQSSFANRYANTEADVLAGTAVGTQNATAGGTAITVPSPMIGPNSGTTCVNTFIVPRGG